MTKTCSLHHVQVLESHKPTQDFVCFQCETSLQDFDPTSISLSK